MSKAESIFRKTTLIFIKCMLELAEMSWLFWDEPR